MPNEQNQNGGKKTDNVNRKKGFPTRVVYFYTISCLRYTILVGNPRKFIFTERR